LQKSRQALRHHEQLAEAAMRAASVKQYTPSDTIRPPVRAPPALNPSEASTSQTDANRLVPLTLEDEASLAKVPWYCGELDRATIVRTLLQCEEGAFVVRHSASQQHCLALSVNVPPAHNANRVSHFLIMSVQGGFRLKVRAVLVDEMTLVFRVAPSSSRRSPRSSRTTR